jgi:hypothetical protein
MYIKIENTESKPDSLAHVLYTIWKSGDSGVHPPTKEEFSQSLMKTTLSVSKQQELIDKYVELINH